MNCQRTPQADDERRTYPRLGARYPLHVALHRGPGERPLVAQGEVLNASLSGIYIETPQPLEVGQLVDLAIPTKGCPEDFSLPKAFLGKARVARIDAAHGDTKRAALAVDRDLSEDLSYAAFVEYHHRQAAQSESEKIS